MPCYPFCLFCLVSIRLGDRSVLRTWFLDDPDERQSFRCNRYGTTFRFLMHRSCTPDDIKRVRETIGDPRSGRDEDKSIVVFSQKLFMAIYRLVVLYLQSESANSQGPSDQASIGTGARLPLLSPVIASSSLPPIAFLCNCFVAPPLTLINSS